jgi:hypothetical protein
VASDGRDPSHLSGEKGAMTTDGQGKLATGQLGISNVVGGPLLSVMDRPSKRDN